MKVQTVGITPEFAAQILTHNTHNRPLLQRTADSKMPEPK